MIIAKISVISGISKKIAFVSDRNGNEDIYVMNVDGNNLQRLTRHPADDEGPSWFDPEAQSVSPSEKRVTFWGWLKRLIP